jgi:hypothetical protein
VPYETAVQQWRDGEQRMRETPAEQRAALDHVVDRLVAELRRRLGGPFTLDELAGLYDQGTSWCTDVAYQVAPEAPWAWDARTTADAAFARYMHDATDYAGGKRVDPMPDD